MEFENVVEFEIGVYLESARGWRALAEVPRIAAKAGVLELTAHDRRALVLFENDRPRLGEGTELAHVVEHVIELADRGEEALNDLAPNGTAFSWRDGEFGLWPE